jgi:hypothetical protein
MSSASGPDLPSALSEEDAQFLKRYGRDIKQDVVGLIV